MHFVAGFVEVFLFAFEQGQESEWHFIMLLHDLR